MKKHGLLNHPSYSGSQYALNLFPDDKVSGPQMWPTRVSSAPGGPDVEPMNIVIRVCLKC